MSLAVGIRYARALADITFGGKSNVDPDQLTAEITKFLEEYEASRPLREVLATPAVSNSKKRAVISVLTERLGLSTITRNFLFVLIEHRRQGLLKTIRDAYIRLVDERRGVVQANVTSAVELSAEQRAAIETQLATNSGKRVRSEYQVDPKLLGGVVVRIGSQVYDGSVRGRLQALGAQLSVGA